MGERARRAEETRCWLGAHLGLRGIESSMRLRSCARLECKAAVGPAWGLRHGDAMCLVTLVCVVEISVRALTHSHLDRAAYAPHKWYPGCERRGDTRAAINESGISSLAAHRLP